MTNVSINLSNEPLTNGGTTSVSVTGTPSAGQVIEATSATTAQWQTPSGGSVTLAGDVTGSSGANTAVALRGKALNSALASVGANQDGYALTWVNGSSDWEAKPTAANSFIFMVGGSGPNVFGTWASLMHAVALTGNAINFITLDGSGGALHATSGSWNLDMCLFGTRVGGNMDALTFDNGCTITFETLWMTDSVTFIGNSLGVICEMNSNMLLKMEIGSMLYTSTSFPTKTPFFHIASGVNPNFYLNEFAIFGNGSNAACVVASGGTAYTYTFNGAMIQSGAFSGAGSLVATNSASGGTQSQPISSVTLVPISTVGNLVPGTSAQILLNNSTPTPTWTTLSGDMTVVATGTTAVASVNGVSISGTAASGRLPIASSSSASSWTAVSGDISITSGGVTTVASSTGSFTIHGVTFNDGYSGAVTTDNGTYTIYTDAVPASSTNDYIITVVGLDSADGYVYRADFAATYQRIATASPVVVGASPVPLNVRNSTGASGWGGAAVTLSSNNVIVTVSGATGKTVHWSLSITRVTVS